MYLLAAIEVTSLHKRRILNRLWRHVHFTSFVRYSVATLRLLTVSADARGALVYAAMCSVAAVVFLTA